MIPLERIEELLIEYSGYDPRIKLGSVFGTCTMGEFVQLLQASHPMTQHIPCLSAIATNEPCQPDDTLKRCTICGFIVDTKFAAEKPK